MAEQHAPDCSDQVLRCITQGDSEGAFAVWSEAAEQVLLKAARDLDGGALCARSYCGRGQHVKPAAARLAAPRFKQGRSGDFSTICPSVSLRVRRLQKQVRRLQELQRSYVVTQKVGIDYCQVRSRLWTAVLTSPAFSPSFQLWARNQGIAVGFALPSLDTLTQLYELVAALANKEAKAAWRAKKVNFQQAVEDSWKREGGALAFRLLRDPQKPAVSHLVVETPVQLDSQQWSPYGKAVFKVKNCCEFAIGDELSAGDLKVQVTQISPPYLSVNRRLTRREAAHLVRTLVSADPDKWAPHFLEHWEEFWRRDPADEVPNFEDIISSVPSVPVSRLPPIRFDQWREALTGTKAHTMRGIDSWSPRELKSLPESMVAPLLALFQAIEGGLSWPRQLTTWLVVLLRKTNAPVPTWGEIRPISVSGLVYRIWSRIRTRQFLVHTKQYAPSLVNPRLSTRAIWTFLADYCDRATQRRRPLCGVVLDIIKAFNVLNRHFVLALLQHLGYDPRVASAWIGALNGMKRHVLVQGMSCGESTSTTGIPEGDALSIIGMYVVSFAFSCFIRQHAPVELVVTYADNWELVAASWSDLLGILPHLEKFVDLARLPLAPEKCWVWGLSREGRQQLRRSAKIFGELLPVKLQAKDLGADIAYCLRKAARVRNSRVQTGHTKLCRLRGIPGSRHHKARLLISSVWPHTLHAAETALVPKTTFARLRTLAARALDLAPKGSSPWLACSVPGQRCVDPEFQLLLSRFRLFRQVLRELTEWHDLFCGRLVAPPSRYLGPSRLLSKVLRQQGWQQVAPLVFIDEWGRSFNLLFSSESHVLRLLTSKWMDRVVREIRHRKYLRDLASISLPLTRTELWLMPGQRPLVYQQWIGAIFSKDHAKHFCENRGVCPMCQGVDNRLHRLMYCPGTLHLRSRCVGIGRIMADLPIATVAYGLWEEHPLLRRWHGCLDSLPYPSVPRKQSESPTVVYSDGTCLHPRYPDLRLSAGAVVHSRSDGTWDLVWTGIVPTSDQSAFRAELLAGLIALQSATVMWLFSDCWAFVKVARRFLEARRVGIEPAWPVSNLDLWIRLWESLAELDCEQSSICWIRSHVDPAKVSGISKVHAFYNGVVDSIAKHTVRSFRSMSLMYQRLVTDHASRLTQARQLSRFHALVAECFANQTVEEPPSVVQVDVPVYLGLGHTITPFGMEQVWCVHRGFLITGMV